MERKLYYRTGSDLPHYDRDTFCGCCGAKFLDREVKEGSYNPLAEVPGIALSFHPLKSYGNWNLDVVETRNGPITIGTDLGDN